MTFTLFKSWNRLTTGFFLSRLSRDSKDAGGERSVCSCSDSRASRSGAAAASGCGPWL